MAFLTFVPLLVLLIPCFSYGKIHTKDRQKKIALSMLFLMIVILLGLKDGGGQDDSSYRDYYELNYSSHFTFLKGMEPLFLLLRYLGKTLGFNYKWLFLSYSIIAATFICAALNNWVDSAKDVQLYAAAFLFLVLPKSFTVMRQTVAMAIVFYNYSLPDKEWKKKIVLWVCTILTHYGFIVLLPFEIYGLAKKYHVSRTVRFAVPLMCGLVSMTGIVNWTINKVVTITGMYSYMRQAKISQDNGSGIVNIVVIGLYYLIFMLSAKYDSQNGLKGIGEGAQLQTMERKLWFGSFVYISLLLFTQNIWGAARIAYYYLLFAPMLILQAVDIIPFDKKSYRYAKNISIVLLYLMYLWFARNNILPGASWSLVFLK